MDLIEMTNIWLKEERKGFEGWDFSHLEGRWETGTLPWDYKNVINKYLDSSDKLLDMGTGGGEFVLSLGHPYNNLSVTEGWEPNLELCNKKLKPLGIEVKQVLTDNKLPFEDNTFDIIINRHEDYDIEEVKRVLKHKGIFITQQVGGHNNLELSKFLIPNHERDYLDHNLENEVNRFKKSGFTIDYNDERYMKLKFFDVGAIVYFAKIIVWEFPDFTVENTFEKLCMLEERLHKQGYIDSSEHRFIIVATNNKN